jgi:glycosyltransferase involved in cell wall biosynthesis
MDLIGRKLLIISHTLHAVGYMNKIVGWGPTVTEINHLSYKWEEVVHIACLTQDPPEQSLIPYTNTNIRFCSIPLFGGISIMDKLTVLTHFPRICKVILKELRNSTHVQIRLPMGIGVYILPLFYFFPRKFELWIKYATNWGHVSSSFGYRFQRWFLDMNFLKCCVTINGNWPNQSKHLITFENPCITSKQLDFGYTIKKDFKKQFKVVFAGRLEDSKGVKYLLDIIEELNYDKISEWVFLGDGPLLNELKNKFSLIGKTARFLGFVSQDEVHKEFYDAHFLVLPSKSEGFPKVIAEAWNYKCIPISSSVGSISHYLYHGVNGFLIQELNSLGVKCSINDALNTSYDVLEQISLKGHELASKFTYDKYIGHLNQSIFNGY